MVPKIEAFKMSPFRHNGGQKFIVVEPWLGINYNEGFSHRADIKRVLVTSSVSQNQHRAHRLFQEMADFGR